MDVWVKKSDGVTNVIGEVWPEDPVYFGDFSNPAAKVIHSNLALSEIEVSKNWFIVGLVENSCSRVPCCSSLWRPLDWHEWACKLHHRTPGGGMCRYLHCPITNFHKKWPICVTLANNINYPPYKPAAVGSELADKTICGDHQHYWGSHYDTHNMYGYSESGATLDGNVYLNC